MIQRFKRLFKHLIEVLSRPEMSVLPGQLAFFFILSLVPTITIIGYISSFLSISIADLNSYFNINFDPAFMELLTPNVQEASFHLGMLVLLVVGIYLASNGMNSVIVTANNIYGIKPKHFIYRRIKAIVMVFFIIMLFLFILLVPVFGNFLLSLLESVTGPSDIYNIFNLLKTPFSWLVIFLFIKILYILAPDKDVPSKDVNIGAIFTSLGWILATEIYLYYVGHFANYTLYYSSLSNIAILMIWIYILATIFVIGMGINYYEEQYVIENTEQLSKEDIEIAIKNHNKEK